MNKRNVMEVAPQALLYAAGIVLSISLVALMIAQFNNAKKLTNAINDNLAKTTQEIEEADITKYDGCVIKGIDVVNFCRRYWGRELVIRLKANQFGSTPITVTQDNVGLLRDSSSSLYIYPAEQWGCTVSRNDNDVITEIIFEKKEGE